MLEEFLAAYQTAFHELPQTVIWSNDRVIRTSAMQSYIYPRIAHALGLYLVCELPTDAAYFDRAGIDQAAANHAAYPNPHNAMLCIEHENNCVGAQHEIEQLRDSQAALNVLITYLHANIDQQIGWANDHFREILQGVTENRDFLVIFPSEAQDGMNAILAENHYEEINMWRFFMWNNHENTFAQVVP